MSRVQIPVAMIEFDEGGNTIWVQSPIGATVLRIKVEGRIRTTRCHSNVVSHLDLIARDRGPEFCLGPEIDPALPTTDSLPCELCGEPMGKTVCENCDDYSEVD